MAYSRSRYQKIQEKKNLRKAALYTLLTFALALALIFLGIPILIKMAVFVGNLRSSGQPVESQDKFAPPSPRLYPLMEATNSALLTLEGQSESGTTVQILLNELPLEEVVASTEGYFSLSGIHLQIGQNEIKAIAVDKAGNHSQSSPGENILFDDTPPELVIGEPQDNQVFSKDKVIIKGKTELNASLTINERFVVTDSQGNFSFSQSLSAGENLVKIKAVDQAGNQTEKELRLKLE